VLSGGHRVSMAWLIACMTLLVVGELLVAPLGLSMMLRLTPPRFVGVVVGRVVRIQVRSASGWPGSLARRG
jgi:dipeptide/tripeptide permease